MFKTKSIIALTVMGLAMSANAVVVDGVMTAGDGYANSFVVNWHNDHHADDSAYGSSQNLETEIYWTTSGGNFYMIVEVPIFAKNMMWGDALAADEDELDAYFYDNTHYHHSENKVNDKLKFGTMVGSERIGWGSNEVHLDRSSNDGDWDAVSTSLDWVLANGCSTDSCDRKDVAMTFEFQYLNLSEQDILDLIASIQSDSVLFHLSDERQGDVTFAPVPVPAAVWLLGSGLLGMLGFFRKK